MFINATHKVCKLDHNISVTVYIIQAPVECTVHQAHWELFLRGFVEKQQQLL